MRYAVVDPFTIKTPQGDVILTKGKVLELSPEQAERLGGKVVLADTPTINNGDTWPPEPEAWLTDTGEIRTNGIFPGEYPDGGLTPEIVRLTADNMPLQAKLLRENVAYYSAPSWIHTIRQWRERARVLFEIDGLDLHAANWKAAEGMHLLAFADELMLKEPPR
jgi:hypothetical protein